MVKIQVNSQGKAYLTTGGKALVAPEGGSSELARYTVQNGVASMITTIPADAFSDITEIGNRALYHAYSYTTFDNNTSLDMSSVQTIGQEGMRETFYKSTGMVSVNLSSLVTIGNSGLRSLFSTPQSPYTLVSVDLSSLVTIGNDGMSSSFGGNENLSSFDISSLQTIGRDGMSGVCDSCTSLTNVDFSSIVSVGNAGLGYAFYNCDLRTISFDSLSYIGDGALGGCFGENYNLSSVSFPSLTSNSFTYEDEEGYCFDYMLGSCSNVTVHFPSNLQSIIGSWDSVVSGFGGTNTTVLFDLPATE